MFNLLLLFCILSFSIENNTITVNSSKNDYKITVIPNQPFVIKIEGNPTTGYIWTLKNTDEELQKMTITCNKNEDGHFGTYIPPNTEPGLVGAGGIYEFTFTIKKAIPPRTLTFVYQRPWENTPIREVHVEVSE